VKETHSQNQRAMSSDRNCGLRREQGSTIYLGADPPGADPEIVIISSFLGSPKRS